MRDGNAFSPHDRSNDTSQDERRGASHRGTHNASKAELIKGTFWSDLTSWADGKLPTSSPGLNIRLDVSSFDDLGTVKAPFVADEIVGVPGGTALPSLLVGSPFKVTGLQVDDIKNLNSVSVGEISNFGLVGGGKLDVRGDLVNVANLRLGLNSQAEIGHGVGSTMFFLNNATLILDKPQHHALDNQIGLIPVPPVGTPLPIPSTNSIELGGVIFDHAAFIPSVPGSSNGEIQLSNHGRSVYQLTHVTGASSASFAGVDPTTGYNILHVIST